MNKCPNWKPEVDIIRLSIRSCPSCGHLDYLQYWWQHLRYDEIAQELDEESKQCGVDWKGRQAMRLRFWRRLDNLAYRIKFRLWFDKGRPTPALAQKVVTAINERLWAVERIEARKRGAKNND